LGIGTVSPAQTLHVKTSTAATPITLGVLSNSTTLPALSFNGAYASSTMAGTYSLTGSLYTTVPSGAAHYFAVADSIKATLDSSGNLGLGVTPYAWYSGSSAKVIQNNNGSFYADSANSISLASNWGFTAAGAQQYISNGFATRYIQSSGQHIWNTAASGTAGNAISFTQAMTLDSSGNLLVGTTSANPQVGIGLKLTYDSAAPYFSTVGSSTSSSNYSYLLYSTGASAFRFYVSYSGVISATSTTISGISDQRLKENIRDLDDGLEKVMALQPRKFDWKEGKGADIKNARGFIAQEFETVFPDMIEEWLDPAPEGEEPYKAVNANLIPTLVKAIQEQQALITSLTARITALEGN